jgi:DMSO/TMAO reductase YedYZ molybdopterin-dependent catalytic subunit
MLTLDGAVAAPHTFTFDELRALPRSPVRAHLPGKPGEGVPLGVLLARVQPGPAARFVFLRSADGAFGLCVPLADVVDNALVAVTLDGGPLPTDQGGPARFFVLTPRAGLDACANVKQLGSLTFSAERLPDIGHVH